MRGVATIDRQPNGDTIVVWVTSREGLNATHTNAVEVAVADADDALDAVISLTRCCAVLVTDGSTLDGLPIEGTPLRRADLDGLLEEVAEEQGAIVAAVRDHQRRTRSKSLVVPQFPRAPSAEDFAPEEDTPSARAFALANFAQRAWTSWLRTDEERRRRTVQPKTGLTPWVMPEAMNAPNVPDFPSKFAESVHEQPLV